MSSSATPTAMSTVVPANGKLCTSTTHSKQVRQDGDDRDEQRAGQGDPVDDLGQVALGLRTGTDAGDEAALATDLVGLADRVEGDRVVEVGEGHDHQREQRDVHEVLAVDDVAVDLAAGS